MAGSTLESHLHSIGAWRTHEERGNVRAPVRLDAGASDWQLEKVGVPSAFTAILRRDNPEWGVRDIADLRKLAASNRLRLAELVEMPANNATLVFERS